MLSHAHPCDTVSPCSPNWRQPHTLAAAVSNRWAVFLKLNFSKIFSLFCNFEFYVFISTKNSQGSLELYQRLSSSGSLTCSKQQMTDRGGSGARSSVCPCTSKEQFACKSFPTGARYQTRCRTGCVGSEGVWRSDYWVQCYQPLECQSPTPKIFIPHSDATVRTGLAVGCEACRLECPLSQTIIIECVGLGQRNGTKCRETFYWLINSLI